MVFACHLRVLHSIAVNDNRKLTICKRTSNHRLILGGGGGGGQVRGCVFYILIYNVRVIDSTQYNDPSNKAFCSNTIVVKANVCLMWPTDKRYSHHPNVCLWVLLIDKNILIPKIMYITWTYYQGKLQTDVCVCGFDIPIKQLLITRNNECGCCVRVTLIIQVNIFVDVCS